MAKTIEV